jgi:hypothetical protein
VTSAVGICSNALLQLGDKPIASLTENTDRASLCNNLWPMVRDYILRKGVWSCTRASVILAPESAAPEFDWARSFLLPGDCMRILQVGERGHRTPYELRARRILSNAGTLPLVYQQRITDPVQWDDAMVDAACAEMAARLAYPITQSASMAQTMQGRAAQALREAQAISGQDNPPEDWADSPFIEARF